MDKHILEKFIGSDKISVSDAMRRIDNNSNRILFLVDDFGVLDGCVTDGDLRRFLLSGGKMGDSVIEAANIHPRTARTIDEARLLYHQKFYYVIPIVDELGRIINLFLGESDAEVSPLKPSLNVPVVINAGGKGTRLDPYTRVLPKPLIPVGEKPIIEHIMNEYRSYGCDQFHIIVNYKKNLIKAYFADVDNFFDIKWYDEEKPLGTGGGLSLLKGVFEEAFFFTNCDSLLSTNYESIVKFHKENKNIITMVCVFKTINIPYGVVEMGLNGAIEEMKEKPVMSFLTNAGIYLVEPEVIDDIGNEVSISFPDVIELERSKGKKVAVYPVSENDWMDMGQLPELEKMRRKLFGE